MLWGRVANFVLWKTEEKWRAKGWENEYTLRGMMWAENFWMLSHNREIMVCIVNDIIEGLLDLDMEPKPESGHEDLECGKQRQSLESAFLRSF